MLEVRLPDARAIALRAQGFGEKRRARNDIRRMRRALARIELLQIDSVNVLVRTQYLPLFSRLGPYDRATLDTMAYDTHELFEYWGHEASLMPLELHPLIRWKMEKQHPRYEAWAKANDKAIEDVYRQVVDRGALPASEFKETGGQRGIWWDRSFAKSALEWLFVIGRVTTASRRNFERVYDLPERVIPSHVLNAPTPPENEARKELLVRSARALGVATASELADYFRIHKPTARALIAELAEEGALVQVRVEGAKHPGFMDPAAKARAVEARALLSPFDPIVWERARTEHLFGFRYRIEIYVPAPKRVHGYYVLPFLLGDLLVARVDLKADRSASRLLARGLYGEPGIDKDEVAQALAEELAILAAWLGLDRVLVERKGNLSAAVAARLR